MLNIDLPTPVWETNMEAMSKLESDVGFNCSIANVCSRLVPLVDLTSILSTPSLKSYLSSGVTCQARIKYAGLDDCLMIISSAQSPLTISFEIDLLIVKMLRSLESSDFKTETEGIGSSLQSRRYITSKK